MSTTARINRHKSKGRMRAATFPSRRRDDADFTDQEDKDIESGQRGFFTPPACHRLKRSSSTSRKSKHRHRARPLSILSAPGSQNDSTATGTSPSPQESLRMARRSSRDDIPVSKQRRLFVGMFSLVTILASVQIMTFVLHPPRDYSSTSHRAATGPTTGIAIGTAPDERIEIRRMTSGGDGISPQLESREGQVHVNGAGRMEPVEFIGRDTRVPGALDYTIRTRDEEGPSAMSPRAFEMVAADVGNLRDMVEKLDHALKDIMDQQSKDIATVINHLGVQQESHEEVVPAMHGTAGAAFHRQDEVVDGVEAPGTDPVKTEPSQETPLQPVDAENHLDGTESTSSLPVPKYRMNEPGDGENATATAMTPTAPEDDVGITAATNQSTAVTNRSVVSLTSTAADQSDEYPVEEDAGKDKERDAVWNAYAQGRWVNGQWVPKVLVDDSPPDLTKLPEDQRRVLILSERRSGGQAIGATLNADSGAFYIGDPCRMGGGPEALDGATCSAMVTRLLACQPTINDVRNLFSFSFIVQRSRPLSGFEQLRWDAGGTPDDNDELVRSWLARDCALSNLVVIKETRMVEIARDILEPRLGTEFLHVVRDPRAAIHGIAETWGTSKSKFELAMSEDCTEFATRHCGLTENKLVHLTQLGRHRFRVLKYEMFVGDPLATMRSVYTWLKLGEIPKEVEDTLPGAVQLATEGNTNAAFERATRWAWEMPQARRVQIQEACETLLVALGYDEPTGEADQTVAEVALGGGREVYWRPPGASPEGEADAVGGATEAAEKKNSKASGEKGKTKAKGGARGKSEARKSEKKHGKERKTAKEGSAVGEAQGETGRRARR